jgi:SAM-dependent methyltransferase
MHGFSRHLTKKSHNRRPDLKKPRNPMRNLSHQFRNRLRLAGVSPAVAKRSCELYWGEAWLSLWRMFEAEAIVTALSALLPRDRPIRLLEAGCGDGRFYDLLMFAIRQRLGNDPLHAPIHGFGLDGDAIRLRNISERNLTPVLGDLETIPLAKDSVDIVICNSTLEHVGDPQTAIGEMSRVLRRGGHLVMTVPSLSFESHLLGYKLRTCVGRPSSALAWARARSQRIQHLHYQSPEMWERRLSEANLHLESYEPIVPSSVVTIGDPLQWLRDRNIGGSRYSRRVPTSSVRDLSFRAIRNTAIAMEWLLSRGISFFNTRRPGVESGAYLFVAHRA